MTYLPNYNAIMNYLALNVLSLWLNIAGCVLSNGNALTRQSLQHFARAERAKVRLKYNNPGVQQVENLRSSALRLVSSME